MKLSLFGRFAMALLASLALGLGMTACGGGTIGYMWVLGQQYNQIVGFKIDDYTGNLTQIPGSPFTTSGVTPVSLVVRGGGRYLYVLNQGSGGDANGPGTDANVSVYSVGGDGSLTFQTKYTNLQGYVPIWIQTDASGTFIYVLNKYSPSGDGNGEVTVYQSDASTGRLTLITNAQTKIGDLNTNYFEVGADPIMMKAAGGCLFTVNGADQTISPYVTSTTGQLNLGTTQTIQTGADQISSINGNGQYVFLTDAGANRLFQYTVGGSGCNLTSTSGTSYPNFGGASDPQYSFIDTKGQYVYVLNQFAVSGNPDTAASNITAWKILSGGNLTPLTDAPYTTGAGPVCMVEDPTTQWMYISNHDAGTVTGKHFDGTSGDLSDLAHGSTFPASGLASCLVESGAID